jgi:hypothetical protein
LAVGATLDVIHFYWGYQTLNWVLRTCPGQLQQIRRYLNLDWYTNLTKLCSRYQDSSILVKRKSTLVAECVRKEFTKHWTNSKRTSPKLEFYNQIKSEFRTEDYLSLVEKSEHRPSLTRFRTSAHNLYIERGSYETPLVKKKGPPWNQLFNTKQSVEPHETRVTCVLISGWAPHVSTLSVRHVILQYIIITYT